MSCLYSSIIQPRPVKAPFIALFSPYSVNGLVYLLATADLEVVVILSYVKFLDSWEEEKEIQENRGYFHILSLPCYPVATLEFRLEVKRAFAC